MDHVSKYCKIGMPIKFDPDHKYWAWLTYKRPISEKLLVQNVIPILIINQSRIATADYHLSLNLDSPEMSHFSS